ncbi:MAG TPA: anti-sigma factor [Streptosporangiaceae bacterium]
MSHTDPVILALRALGEAAGTAHDAEHAETCARCRAELARLTEVVRLARNEGPGERLQVPPPQVWDRIAAAAGAAQPSPGAELNGASAPAARDAGKRPGRRARRLRGRLATGLAGLAAGLVIGIGGTAGIVQLTRAPATRVVAQIELSPLPQFPQWQDAAGTAVMRATASQQLMVVTLHAPRQPAGFYEVWLLARDGVSMISLGDLNASHTGAFVVPPGTDLRNYSRVDISLQPFNGSTQHSDTSVVRGSWPAAALGGTVPPH